MLPAFLGTTYSWGRDLVRGHLTRIFAPLGPPAAMRAYTEVIVALELPMCWACLKYIKKRIDKLFAKIG